MQILRIALARLRAVFRRDAIADEIREEMQFHLDQRASELHERGLGSDEAARTAKKKFGNVPLWIDRGYDVRGAGMLETISFEVRHATRTLWHHRGTSVFAFAIMTITMAAATVTFSVVDGVALRPLPYGQPDGLVSLTAPSPTAGRFYPAFPHDYFAWLDGTQSFEGLAAARFVAAREFDDGGRTHALVTRAITANLFDVLRVRPALGRFFDPEHERPGGPEDVIVSHAFWTQYLGGTPDALGRVLTLGEEHRRVIGVLPEGVTYPIMIASEPDLYVPYVATPDERAGNGPRLGTIQIVGRLRPGVSVEQARADANRITSAVVVPLHDQVVGPSKTWLMLVLAAAALILLVACVNVASLLMARATTRSRELATREALGASRVRLAAGLLLEGLLLALVSATAAAALARATLDAAKAVVPPGLARLSDVAIDGRVLAVVATVSVLCGLVFSTAPVWRAARSSLLAFMQTNGGSVIGGRTRNRPLWLFLAADVAFVCTLLVGTTLVIVSFVHIETADLGFDRRNVMKVSYTGSLEAVAEDHRTAAAAALRHDLLARAESVPGVVHAAVSTNATAPLSGGSVRYSIDIPGVGDTGRDGMLETNMVSPDYFAVMGMQIVRGRGFDQADTIGAPLVMVINEIAARRFFPDRDPVGQPVEFQGARTIVGVLRDVYFLGPEHDAPPAMYTPVDQSRPFPGADTFGTLVVRTAGDARRLEAALLEAVRPALSSLPPASRMPAALQLPTVNFVDDGWRRITATRRFNAAVMATFGLVAILIAALGIFGTMAFVVAQQTRAIGLRTALGASRGHIMRGVLLTALRFVALGTAIGLTAAWLGSELMVSFVFGIEPTAPSVYAGVAAFLALVALIAAWIPARRAADVNPIVALRAE